MKYALVFLLSLLLEATLLQTLFRPGFVAPDLLLIVLLARAYLLGRDAILWAIAGGTFLDLMTDTVGLHLTTEVLSVYLFLLLQERLLFRTALTYILPSSFLLLLKKSLAYFIMRAKFSFELSLGTFLFSWAFEVVLLFLLYFLYIRKKE